MKARLSLLLTNDTSSALIALMDCKELGALHKVKLVRLRKLLVEKHRDLHDAKLNIEQQKEAMMEEVEYDMDKIPSTAVIDSMSSNQLFSLSEAGIVDLDK